MKPYTQRTGLLRKANKKPLIIKPNFSHKTWPPLAEFPLQTVEDIKFVSSKRLKPLFIIPKVLTFFASVSDFKRLQYWNKQPYDIQY